MCFGMGVGSLYAMQITAPLFPRIPCLRLAGIFMSALLAFLHPHTTYLAGFIFIAIWWEFVEKLKNSTGIITTDFL